MTPADVILGLTIAALALVVVGLLFGALAAFAIWRRASGRVDREIETTIENMGPKL